MRSAPLIYDFRHQVILVGDTVAYTVPSQVELRPGIHDDGRRLNLHVKRSPLKWSKVAKIEMNEPGFLVAEAVVVTLEDGHQENGDAENGGWNLLKLQQ